MSFFNVIITLCVGLVMAGGAALTYKNRMAEQQDAAIVSPTQFVKNVANLHASLPKWDDKNWKGLTHHPAGHYKKNADKQNADKQLAAKQNAAR